MAKALTGSRDDVLTVRMSRIEADRLRERARRDGMALSAMVRAAIDRYIGASEAVTNVGTFVGGESQTRGTHLGFVATWRTNNLAKEGQDG